MSKDYLEFAKALALEAGEIMKKHFMGDVGVTYKHDKSRVTIADTAINDLIIKRVQQAFPDHSVRGEEASTQKAGDKYVWVCDPIDGTYNYSIGVALAMFSLALVEDGVPIIAVAYEPVTDKLYVATKGQGATLNGQKISVSKTKMESMVRIDIADKLQSEVADLRSAGTILYEQGAKVTGLRNSVITGCLVADGSISAALTCTIHPHDIAAVKLLVEEAGGKVTDVAGSEQRYDEEIRGAIMSNGIIHDELVEIVKKL